MFCLAVFSFGQLVTETWSSSTTLGRMGQTLADFVQNWPNMAHIGKTFRRKSRLSGLPFGNFSASFGLHRSSPRQGVYSQLFGNFRVVVFAQPAPASAGPPTSQKSVPQPCLFVSFGSFLGQTRPDSTRVGLTSINIGRFPVNLTDLDEVWNDDYQTRQISEPHASESFEFRAKLGQAWPIPSQTWTEFGQTWPNLTKLGPTSINIGRYPAQFTDVNQVWTKFTKFGAQFGQHWSNFAQLRVEFCRVWPNLCRCWPNLGRRQSTLAGFYQT